MALAATAPTMATLDGASPAHVEHKRGLSQQLLGADNLTNLRHLVSVLKRDLDKGQLKYVSTIHVP